MKTLPPDFLQHVATISDLDDAALAIQTELGIEDGDLAGIFFSGRDDQDRLWWDAWPSMSPEARRAKLDEYVENERLFAGNR